MCTVCMGTWKPKVNIGNHSPVIFLLLIHWGKTPQSNPELADMASLISQLVLESFLSLPSKARIIGRCDSIPTQHLLGFWGSELKSSWLCDKYCNHWILSTALQLPLILLFLYLILLGLNQFLEWFVTYDFCSDFCWHLETFYFIPEFQIVSLI